MFIAATISSSRIWSCDGAKVPEPVELKSLQTVQERIVDLVGDGYSVNHASVALDQVKEIDKNVKAMKGDPKISDIKAKVAITEGVVGAVGDLILKVRIGDDYDIGSSALNVVDQLSQFGVLLGPEGEMYAIVVGGLTSLTTTMLTISRPKKKTALMKMQDAIIEQMKSEFIAAEFAGLSRLVEGQLKTMTEKTRLMEDSIAEFRKDDAPFDDATKQRISANVNNADGVAAIGEVESYVETNRKSTNHERGVQVGKALVLHSRLTSIRVLELLQLQNVYLWKSWSLKQRNILQEEIDRAKTQNCEVASFVFGFPDKDSKYTYSGLYSLSYKQLKHIEDAAGCGKKFPGSPVTIGGGIHLACSASSEDRVQVTATYEDNESTKWVTFNAGGGKLRIFSIGAAGYMFGSGYTTVLNDRKAVMVWSPGNPVSNGEWTVDGSVITCTAYNQAIHYNEGVAYLDTYYKTDAITDYTADWMLVPR
ncbi:hypothetical protein CYMTET_49063 [Cymbomonas tetramitiformis]|uniref:Uncharacterized protein n=1 Tax=Cymbomonas tetramitiformis TaxID=36881 RepID=A0AAE0EW55_9CHLO|nr:hypothetical protein CYMTET_49063 [Cymbomonas tetramitiformis]